MLAAKGEGLGAVGVDQRLGAKDPEDSPMGLHCYPWHLCLNLYDIKLVSESQSNKNLLYGFTALLKARVLSNFAALITLLGHGEFDTHIVHILGIPSPFAIQFNMDSAEKKVLDGISRGWYCQGIGVLTLFCPF